MSKYKLQKIEIGSNERLALLSILNSTLLTLESETEKNRKYTKSFIEEETNKHNLLRNLIDKINKLRYE